MIELSQSITISGVILLCLTTGILGLVITRREGFGIWTLLESELQNKRLPTEELLEEVLLFWAGILLILPGLLSDAIAYLLIIPLTRQKLIELLLSYLKKNYGSRGM